MVPHSLATLGITEMLTFADCFESEADVRGALGAAPQTELDLAAQAWTHCRTRAAALSRAQLTSSSRDLRDQGLQPHTHTPTAAPRPPPPHTGSSGSMHPWQDWLHLWQARRVLQDIFMGAAGGAAGECPQAIEESSNNMRFIVTEGWSTINSALFGYCQAGWTIPSWTCVHNLTDLVTGMPLCSSPKR